MRSSACWRRRARAPACLRTSRPCDDPTVTIPQALQAGIDEIVAAGDRRDIERAARTKSDVVAYLATRAPATYAAAAAVLGQIQLVRPEWAPASILDLGAGP